MKDQHYGSEEKYLYALADALKEEYDAIHRAGFVLQVDCPDLCMSRHNRFSDLSTKEFKQIADLHVVALNHALREIPADRVRLHMCWGNYEGPHHLDIPLTEIIDIALKAKVGALSFEGANPRHEHEWVVFKEFHLPDGLIIIPGVIDSTTNFVEHPELVAQRICRYAEVVGRENIIAGTDCGFGTFVRTEHLRAHRTDHRPAHRVGQAQVPGRGRRHRLKATSELATTARNFELFDISIISKTWKLPPSRLPLNLEPLNFEPPPGIERFEQYPKRVIPGKSRGAGPPARELRFCEHLPAAAARGACEPPVPRGRCPGP